MAGSSPPKHGMTAFMCAILSPDMTTKRLKEMNVKQVAKHYRIPEQWVADERKWQLQSRGSRA